ncbi:hypothetical protein F2Q69_00059607 [Brassica cretica]|uniref:Uncharacterized protein n=1 Tax=Brassica cretica TaxID=69181 RepID=A0A8S9RD43_BRACR|nr:hypothetical protein F2Q69_00059607 [Brassica cretica]
MRPARCMAEQDRRHDQPSLNGHAVLDPSVKLLPQNLIKLALVSLRSEAPLELYDFKTARTHFLV